MVNGLKMRKDGIMRDFLRGKAEMRGRCSFFDLYICIGGARERKLLEDMNVLYGIWGKGMMGCMGC